VSRYSLPLHNKTLVPTAGASRFDLVYGMGGRREAALGVQGWRLGSALMFEQGVPQVLDQYWCRHTSPHEVSGAQCLSRRLVLAVFELVFVFRLGG